ncbi:hypothetical protein BH18ACT7_BH18ACT7_12360 [soil metagenome]
MPSTPACSIIRRPAWPSPAAPRPAQSNSASSPSGPRRRCCGGRAGAGGRRGHERAPQPRQHRAGGAAPAPAGDLHRGRRRADTAAGGAHDDLDTYDRPLMTQVGRGWARTTATRRANRYHLPTLREDSWQVGSSSIPPASRAAPWSGASRSVEPPGGRSTGQPGSDGATFTAETGPPNDRGLTENGPHTPIAGPGSRVSGPVVCCGGSLGTGSTAKPHCRRCSHTKLDLGRVGRTGPTFVAVALARRHGDQPARVSQKRTPGSTS